jgi:hypothetical protein
MQLAVTLCFVQRPKALLAELDSALQCFPANL